MGSPSQRTRFSPDRSSRPPRSEVAASREQSNVMLPRESIAIVTSPKALPRLKSGPGAASPGRAKRLPCDDHPNRGSDRLMLGKRTRARSVVAAPAQATVCCSSKSSLTRDAGKAPSQLGVPDCTQAWHAQRVPTFSPRGRFSQTLRLLRLLVGTRPAPRPRWRR